MSVVNRRVFLRSSASCLAAGPLIVPRVCHAASPSQRLSVAVIGLGSRGFNLIDALLKKPEAQIVAVCDVDRLHHRDRPSGKGPAFGRVAAEKRIGKAYANSRSGTKHLGLQVTADFREVLSRPDVDAVAIATPDHWHALCTLKALQAGKDVYCEKPITHTFHEGRVICDAVAKHPAVFQTGSQQRSDPLFRRLVELVRNGWVGKVSSVEVGLPSGYETPQGDASVTEPPESLDYPFWCGPAERLPYMRARHHRWWRGHRAYGGGVLMDWIGHHNDIAQWAIDQPLRSVDVSEWSMPQSDVYNTPHHYGIRCEYGGDVQSTISSRNTQGLKVIGDEGWVYARRGILQASDPSWTEPNFEVGKVRVERSDDHMQNFLDRVRDRGECVAPAAAAHRSITPGHLAYVSQALGRRLNWDAEAQRVEGDADADRLLNLHDYRAPWSL